MRTPVRILHLEDDPGDAELVRAALEAEFECVMHHVNSRKAFEAALEAGGDDLILSDNSLPGYSGVAALKAAREKCPQIPVILLSDTLGEEQAIESLQQGAVDYVLKVRLGRLIPAVRRALVEAEEKKQRRQAEAALRESEQRFQAFMNNSPVVAFLKDRNGNYRYVNETFARLSQRNLEEIYGKTDYDLWPKEADLLRKNEERALEANEVIEIQEELALREGLPRRWLVYNFPVRTASGEVFLGGVAADVTEHWRAERALQESERRFRMMADSAPVLIWLADRERKCIYFNQTWLQFTGRTLNEELGEGWSQGVHPDDRPECLKVCHAAFANLQPFEMEFRLRRADAQYRWVLNSGVPRFDDDGSFAGYIGCLIDITDRRRAEERSRYQAALLDKAQDAILVQDLNSRLISWNKGAERIYGWAASEAVGKHANDLLFKDPSAALEARREIVKNGEWTGELRQVNKNGKELFIQSRWTLVQDPDSNAILVINTDISEKKTLENQFLRVQRLESIGVLAGGIAHDLNNVLVPILVVAELLRTKVTDADSIEWLNTLESSAKHGASLIKQILAFSRGMGGERVQVQLRELIQELQRILREAFPRSIEMQSDIPTDLWAVSGIATHLSQVMMNLCVNARDAMPNGGRIRIKCENVVFDNAAVERQSEANEGPYVLVTVSDTGTGIPAELMDRIFEPFFTTKEMGKGTGLGLSTVKGIIKNHGGFVTVQSEPAKGTTFKLYLPAFTGRPEPSAAKQRPHLLRGNGELIFVVESETAVRTITKATLEEYGYRVLSAADGAQALVVFAENRDAVKLVITGLTLPDIDATALIAALRKFAPSPKFIVVSGTLDQERFLQIRKAGEVESLAKPFTAEQLLELVAGLLNPAGVALA